jgi:hypothetical protein
MCPFFILLGSIHCYISCSKRVYELDREHFHEFEARVLQLFLNMAGLRPCWLCHVLC